MISTGKSKDRSVRLARIASELSSPEQVLQAMAAQGRRPRPELEEEYVPASGPIEESLAKIYADALGLENVSVKDNFFKLGGDSLMIVQIASRIRNNLGIELPMESFFQSPTIESLSINIMQIQHTGMTEGQLAEVERNRLFKMVDQLSEEEVDAMLSGLDSEDSNPHLFPFQSQSEASDLHLLQLEERQPVDEAERYRCSGLEIVALGENRHWIYSRRTHISRVVDQNVVELLKDSETFRKVEEIVPSFRECPDEPAAAGEVRVADLIKEGFLVSEREEILSLTGISPRPSLPLNISTIGCITCKRPDAAERALTSYFRHCQSCERSPRFIVVDDTADPKTGNEYRRMLRSQKEKYKFKVYYGGINEKSQYIDHLATRFGLPKPTLEYALFGLGNESVVSSGRNRNALLLDTQGEGVFSLDDDTICTVVVAPEYQGGLRLLSGKMNGGMDPSEVWSLRDDDFAGKIPSPVDIDILAMHERYLSREVSDCISSAYGNERIDVEQAEAGLSHRLKSCGGKIRVALNGLLGDCGWGSPFPYLLLEHNSFNRLIRSEHLYQHVLASRELLRVTVNTVITDRVRNLMSTFLSYDNRGPLPPFVPIGRGSDYIFALALSKCYRDSFYAYLPYALLHIPSEERTFWPGEVQRSAIGIDFASLIGSLINSCDLGNGCGGGEENLIRLGRFIEEIGMLPESEFEEASRLAVCRERGALIAELETRLDRQGKSADFWARDVKKYLSELRQSVMRPDIAVPLDLHYGKPRDEALRLTQRAVCEYGRLLTWWPAIVKACRELRDDGYRLAQAI